jgi:hypothetical protein
MRTDESKKRQWRSRLVLLLIVAMFFGSFGIAALLRFAGWEPDKHKNFGELLQPPVDFSAQTFLRADGTPYQWRPEENGWRLVFVSNKPCAAACAAQYDVLRRVWLSQGRHATRIDVLWFADLPAGAEAYDGLVPMRPAPALDAALRDIDADAGHPAHIIDSGGFVVMRYPPGFDPSGLRKDLAKLVK